MEVKLDAETEKRRAEFNSIKAEIDKVAKMQKLLIVGIRFSVTALQVLLMFGLFMALNYAFPVSTVIARYMLYSLLASFALAIVFYVLKPLFAKANEEELALMIEKRYPQLLDRFICSVEMNKSEAAVIFSPGLIKALWVDTDKVKKALKLDLRKALALTKGRKYIGFAVGVMITVFAASIVAPEFLLKSTTGIPLVNKFFTALLKGNTLQEDIKKQEKNKEEKLDAKGENIEAVKSLLSEQKNLNKDMKNKINERKKPWLAGKPNTGGLSGICTLDGKPAVDIYVAVKSSTDSRAQGIGAKTDSDGKWVVQDLPTDGN